jgi:small subunit ribosomal protein S2
MKEITLEELLEAGCHFGHQVTRSNPKAREFIFEARDNIHIIDLAITKEWLEEAGNFVLSVGTKRQAAPIVETEVKKSREEIKDVSEKENLMYVVNRWIGGLITNYSEVSKNLKKLKNIEEILEAKDTIYTKKERGQFEKEKQKLEVLYGGIRDIKRVPDLLFIVDSKMEELAVREAERMNVKTVAVVDTNSDPALVTYPIPANDDAVGSIELLTKYILGAWIEGKNSVKIKPVEETQAPKKETKIIEEKVVETEKKVKIKKETKKEPSAKKKTTAKK